MRCSVLGLVALSACGPGVAPKSPEAPGIEFSMPPVRPGVAPPSDEQGIRKLLVANVTNGGLFFDDATCAKSFGTPGAVSAASYDAFAHCLATLHLTPTGRLDSIDDAILLTDKNGFELEAHTVAGALDFIGFSGRAPGVPALPAITPEALEALRISGDPNATFTDDEAKKLFQPMPKFTIGQQLRVCIADDGRVAQVLPGSQTELAVFETLLAHVRDWRFRSFEVAGTPMPVCALVALQYPASPREPDRFPRPPQLSKSGHIFFELSSKDEHHHRVSGRTLITPDKNDKFALLREGRRKLIGAFEICVDETGHFESQRVRVTTELASYDEKILREMKEWVFEPYLANSKPIPVCSVYTFVYSNK